MQQQGNKLALRKTELRILNSEEWHLVNGASDTEVVRRPTMACTATKVMNFDDGTDEKKTDVPATRASCLC